MSTPDDSPADHNAQGPFLSVGKVECVECPSCLFTFDARHEDDVEGGGYACAACGYSADTEIET